MTTGPRLRLGKTLVPGLLAVALFGLMALIALNTSFGEMTGFPDGIAITSEIGYALFDLPELASTDGGMSATEPFLAAFLLIAIALDAALDASLVLAKREEEGEPVGPLSSSRSKNPDTGARPAVDSSGFGRSESTATDGGTAGTETTAAGDSDADSSGGEDR
ncbi:hypothetical protein [Haloterrigena alkaliphila]|uniref:Uncharacterized protein n=1 Tax=Haloterrigena alkaliphila TaxID=2816475 RepID=A0A8A2VCZ3_9EURY|nr:hypothetical protein [Haloterrigena alkaliphila]QSW98314.1 hypothetical protein J0X25_13015 [Haloterrigena alkaliphila]